MRKILTFFGLLSIAFTSNANAQFTPSQTRYCSQHGSELTVKKTKNDIFEIILAKNGMTFNLLAPIQGITIGGHAEIQENQKLLSSENLIANGVLISAVKSYNLSTVLSNESTIKAANVLSEITVVGLGDKMGALYSNEKLIFIGSERLCP